MKTKHLFEDAYYLISNQAVAKSFMFGDENDCKRFKQKIDHHLRPLCDIVAYGLAKDQFQLLVKLKSRKDFESYFLQKYEFKPEAGDIIPESTYIFAQAMANLQSGYAKYFNYKYERDGSLMKGRYFRELIESEDHLDIEIKRVNSLKDMGSRSRIWTFRRKERGFLLERLSKKVSRTSWRCYEEEGVSACMEGFKHKDQVFLRGQFDNLPEKCITFTNQRENIRNLVQFILLKQK